MFNRIAFRYDFMNHFLSGGLDHYWRKETIKQLVDAQPQIVLDMATGTGDMVIMMTKYLKAKKIIGIDISEGMLDRARKKIAKTGIGDKVEMQKGDSEMINFPNGTFDVITVAFGVRNFEHLEKGLEEMLRVLKPGGKLVVLEFSRPRHKGFKTIYHLYLKLIGWGICKWVSKNKEAYRYLHHSVMAFPEGEDFLNILKKVGYVKTGRRALSLGICTIYWAGKLNG